MGDELADDRRSSNRCNSEALIEQEAQITNPVNEIVKSEFKSKERLVAFLQDHRYENLELQIDDVINMMAELKTVSRNSILESSVTAWFQYALGFRVLEVECHEQERPSHDGDGSGGFVLFRLRLDASYEDEISRLSPGEDLKTKYRNMLIEVLPGNLAFRSDSTLDNMVQISWTKAGSVELGGVVASALVISIIVAIGLTSLCRCGSFCSDGVPCLTRPAKPENQEYYLALREFQQRGAEFEVKPDGSAFLRIPAHRSHRSSCPDCAIS